MRNLRGYPTNVSRLPTKRPRRPKIHQTHSNSLTQPTANTPTTIAPARPTEPYKHKRLRHDISTHQTSQAPATSITGINRNLLCIHHISPKQQPRTQRPRGTTSRLHQHPTGLHLLHLGTPTYHNPLHTRCPFRRVPTTRPPRSPYRDVSHTHPKTDRTSKSLKKTSEQRRQKLHPTGTDPIRYRHQTTRTLEHYQHT